MQPFHSTFGHRTGQPGFSLIELLVVISIVALLTSVLLPALSESREAARRSICMSNMRQWHIGAEIFANANNTFYPGVVNHGQSATGISQFKNNDYPNRKPFMHPYSQHLDEYIHSSITWCPSAPERAWPWMPYGSVGTEWYQKTLDALRQDWNVNAADGTYGKITDYAIRFGFGSVHGGINSDSYKAYDPNYYRGFHKSIYPNWRDGFVFIYQQDQADAHEDAIMLMDRSRAPTDSQDAGRYRLVAANHSTRTGPEAAGANILQRTGNVRWMDLTQIWNRSDWTPNYYGRNAYAEGGYFQYVDDAIAEGWQ